MTMHITPEEFRFMIEDITSDLIQMLIEREGYTLPQAVDTIYNSDTYAAYIRPETALYYQSSGYIYEYLIREIKTGKLQ